MYLFLGNLLDTISLTPYVSANIITGLEWDGFDQWTAISCPVSIFAWQYTMSRHFVDFWSTLINRQPYTS